MQLLIVPPLAKIKTNKEKMTRMRQYTMDEMEDRYFGKIGTAKRDKYEYELRMELLGKMIKT